MATRGEASRGHDPCYQETRARLGTRQYGALYQCLSYLNLVLVVGQWTAAGDAGRTGGIGTGGCDCLAGDGGLGSGSPVRLVVDRIQAYPGRPGANHGGAVDHGEVNRLSYGELDEGALDAGGRGGYIYLGDNLARSQGGRAGYHHIPELLGRDGALVGHDTGVHGHQGRRRVRAIDGEARLNHAEDGVVAVVAGDGVAGGAALADAEVVVIRVAEEPAADHLADVAADGAHLPEVGRSRPGGGLRQSSVFGFTRLEVAMSARTVMAPILSMPPDSVI